MFKNKIELLFEKIVKYFKLKFNIDLSGVKIVYTNQVLDEYGKPIEGYEDSDAGACWKSNPNMLFFRPIVLKKKLSQMKNYKIWLCHLIAHELAHIIFNNYYIDLNVNKIPLSYTEYTTTLNTQKSPNLKEEQYCDSLAAYITKELFGGDTRSDIITAYRMVIIAIKHLFKVDLSYIKLIISPYPHNVDGKINKKMSSEEYGGSYCHNNRIYINPNYKAVWSHYSLIFNDTKQDVTKWYVQIISHELGHALHREHPDSLPLDYIKQTKVNSGYLDLYKPGGEYYKGEEKYFSEKVAEWVNHKVIKFIFKEVI